MEVNFAARVKSIEEFQQRFNGEESKPGIENGDKARESNIISLFDFEIGHSGMNKDQFKSFILDFANNVIVNNIHFDRYSAGLYSECLCVFKYKGKQKKITLVLQRELNDKKFYRWAIVAVKGLVNENIVDSNKFYTISPVENEVNFIGLEALLNDNPNHAFGYRSKKTGLNELSIFLTLISCEQIKFEYVQNQTIHYLDIPGYIITLKEKVADNTNSGWLINKIEKKDDNQKAEYLLDLL